MVGKNLGRIAFVTAVIGMGALSEPAVSAVSAAAPAAPVSATSGSHRQQATPVARSVQAGKGWGSMIACSACILGAGVVIAGGPASIIIAVNTPGSALALIACASSCYDAFQ
jgi:hypothetical protein